ncbi:MAG: signal peptidase II [Acidimicrobiaceae bacterium]|nr:signal peptidase II [Acidimicrobiaceae bacterium]
MNQTRAHFDASRFVASLVTALVVVSDQLTKHWALGALSADKTVDIFWTLRFNLVFNSGMAFSQGQGVGRIIGLLALGVVVVLSLTLRNPMSLRTTIGTGLLIGGALGNISDRLFRGNGWMRGAVVDFIDFQWFPVFNLADSAVTIGAGFLILGAFHARERT